MAIVRQSFNLGKNITDIYKAKSEYEYLRSYEGYDEFASNYKGKDVYGAYGRALTSAGEDVIDARQKAMNSTKTYAISLSAFAYNYTARTTRFGLRGQDIQDQLKLQDKMINKAFGIVGAGIVGGLPGAALATVSTAINEILSVSIQNKAYEYRKLIDEQQKSIMQERIGRAVYNSSRRA